MNKQLSQYIKEAKKYSIRLAERIKHSQSLANKKLDWEVKQSIQQSMEAAWDWKKLKE